MTVTGVDGTDGPSLAASTTDGDCGCATELAVCDDSTREFAPPPTDTVSATAAPALSPCVGDGRDASEGGFVSKHEHDDIQGHDKVSLDTSGWEHTGRRLE